MSSTRDAPFNRGTGLLIVEVRHSNPNGDPDAESEPRTMDGDGRGLISPVSFKRKLRDLVADKDGCVWDDAKARLRLEGSDDRRTLVYWTGKGKERKREEKTFVAKYSILELRYRDRPAISKMDPPTFAGEYWDGRIWGNTFLESLKDKKDKEDSSETDNPKKPQRKKDDTETREHFINTGVVQFGPGLSIAPVEVVRLTTN